MLDGIFQSSLQGRPDDPAGVTLDWSSMLAIMGAPPGNGRAREGARTVRDVISAEMWEAVNTTNLTLVSSHPPDLLGGRPSAVYSYVKERCALFWGLTSRTMLRDEASAFLAAGGRIESA